METTLRLEAGVCGSRVRCTEHPDSGAARHTQSRLGSKQKSEAGRGTGS